jgi:hypothetical protein
MDADLERLSADLARLSGAVAQTLKIAPRKFGIQITQTCGSNVFRGGGVRRAVRLSALLRWLVPGLRRPCRQSPPSSLRR